MPLPPAFLACAVTLVPSAQFEDPVELQVPTLGLPVDTILHDLDGDGDLDALVALLSVSRVDWFETLGGGVFASQVNLLSFLPGPGRLAAGDLNGDDVADVVVGCWNDASVRVALGLGGGALAPPVELTTVETQGLVFLRVGDVDGDGQLDIVVASVGRGVGWYRGLGGGQFATGQVIASDSGGAQDLELGDLDGDGVLDVAWAELDQRRCVWARGLGGGAFTAPAPIVTVTGPLNDLTLADLDGDGDLDAVAADGSATLAENLGVLGFGPGAVLPGSAGEALDVAALDYDLDGDLDLFLTEGSTVLEPSVSVSTNLGSLGFFPASSILPTVRNARRAALGDVDQDGDVDVVIASRFLRSVTHIPAAAIGSLGDLACGPAPANSTGFGGRISMRGQPAATANDVTVYADALPPGAFGYFLTSQTAVAPTSVPLSQGLLCLGGSIGRFVGPGQISSAAADGRIGIALDLSALPTPTSLVQAAAGETWTFQAWHRDSAMGAPTSNFTDALSITWR